MLDTLRTINNPCMIIPWLLMKSPMFDFDEDELARISLYRRFQSKSNGHLHHKQSSYS